MKVVGSGKGWIWMDRLRGQAYRMLRGCCPFVPGLPAIKHRHGRQVKRNKAISCGGVGVFAL